MINKTLRILKVLEYVSILLLLYLSDLNHICKSTFEFVFVIFLIITGSWLLQVISGEFLA